MRKREREIRNWQFQENKRKEKNSKDKKENSKEERNEKKE
jgi:hypothetical protein